MKESKEAVIKKNLLNSNYNSETQDWGLRYNWGRYDIGKTVLEWKKYATGRLSTRISYLLYIFVLVRNDKE